MIPKMIHQIWIGGKPLPDEYAGYAETWKRHFPDWEYRLWGDDDDYSWMRNRHEFETADTLSGRSDWLRHELLLRFGGMYIDTDFECLKNFESLVADLPIWSASEDNQVISVGIMGSVPNHPLIRYFVEHLPEWDRAHPEGSPALRTGPGAFTALYRRYVRNGGRRIKVFEPALFYPYHFDERHRKGQTFPNAVAAHHWAGSWLPKAKASAAPAPIPLGLATEAKDEGEPFRHVAPVGTADAPVCWEGRAKRKPWGYKVTACIPHLNTPETLPYVLDLLRLQTTRPYLMVIDTGSPPQVRAELERLRADDCEIHYLAAHAYRHSSEGVSIALDLAQTLCRSEYLFHTHSDCFIRRRDLLTWQLSICNAVKPVVGYQMSPRQGHEWETCPSHTCTMTHMPSVRKHGLTWSLAKWYERHGRPRETTVGWPDTESMFGESMRDAGLAVHFIGTETNFKRHIDANIDHCRSYPGAKAFGNTAHAQRAEQWLREAIADAKRRIVAWSGRRCKSLGSPLDNTDAAGLTCQCQGKWLHQCAKHGECTVDQERHGVACCRTCPDAS